MEALRQVFRINLMEVPFLPQKKELTFKKQSEEIVKK